MSRPESAPGMRRGGGGQRRACGPLETRLLTSTTMQRATASPAAHLRLFNDQPELVEHQGVLLLHLHHRQLPGAGDAQSQLRDDAKEPQGSLEEIARRVEGQHVA